MAGLVPAIHALFYGMKTWMAGMKPAMTWTKVAPTRSTEPRG
jgi:hypothetical protein